MVEKKRAKKKAGGKKKPVLNKTELADLSVEKADPKGGAIAAWSEFCATATCVKVGNSIACMSALCLR